MSEAGDLFDRLRPIQEARGYLFNPDTDFVMELLEALLLNRRRYGYMCCPCRLASGDREKDRDIICPCEYRAQDVRDYGSCYCGLYVDRRWTDGEVPHVYVPERRPPERFV
jgi:ferredoxin-thioredoxin reductase catalytic subunit